METIDNRIVKFLVVFSFVFGSFFLMPNFVNKAHAHEHEHAEGNNPTEVGPCALYGTHIMYAKSTARVEYKETGKVAIALGTMYKCNCGATIVVEG